MSVITGRRLNYFFQQLKTVFADIRVFRGAKITIYGHLDTTSNATRTGMRSITWGDACGADAINSFAIGKSAFAHGEDSFAHGLSVSAEGSDAHAEGRGSHAVAIGSHAEGSGTYANGSYSHAEGEGTSANGYVSHAEGYHTIADNYSSNAIGKFNKNMTAGGSAYTQIGDAFVVGNGTASSSLSNALRVKYDGNVMGTKAFQSSGADYAEYKVEWWDGNQDGEDRVGYMVTIKDNKLYKANEGDWIAGIISGNPSVVGNADEDYYWRYERDEFNRIVLEDVPELVQQTDEIGNLLYDEETHEPIMVETGNIIKNARMKLADGYDPSLQDSYVPRSERKEWDYVGRVGTLPVRDDGTCLPDHFCKCGHDGIATLATERGFDTFYVTKRINDNVVSVEL